MEHLCSTAVPKVAKKHGKNPKTDDLRQQSSQIGNFVLVFP